MKNSGWSFLERSRMNDRTTKNRRHKKRLRELRQISVPLPAGAAAAAAAAAVAAHESLQSAGQPTKAVRGVF